MQTAIVLFTRDLRIRDHPALATAAREAERVIPLFVLDDGILATDFARPNRVAFMRQALEDLDVSLSGLGARLVLRQGDVVAETMRLAAEHDAQAIFVSGDASGYAQNRELQLEHACAGDRRELRVFPGVLRAPARAGESPPRRLSLPAGIRRGRLPAVERLVEGVRSPELPPEGETAGRKRLTAWLRGGLQLYGNRHDDRAADGTSRLSPYLHFGCVSPREVAERASTRTGGGPFVRQLAWRDFYFQLAARPETSTEDLRSRRRRWRADERGFETWKEGRTGYPLVSVDWRLGAAHFFDWLVDGDVASNVGNWQWVAGTGADTRPNRVFNPTRQARRFDPEGEYVRRYVPELGGVRGPAVHEPWKLPAGVRAKLDYPEPIVDHGEAVARLRAHSRRRSGDTMSG